MEIMLQNREKQTNDSQVKKKIYRLPHRYPPQKSLYLDKSLGNSEIRKNMKTADQKKLRSQIPKPIPNMTQKQFQTIIYDVQGRSSTFVRLGFNSEEKKMNRKLFGDVFNLKYKDVKGTLSISDLWSNKDRSNFLKENKIKMNKMKFLERLNNFKKKVHPESLNQSMKTIKQLKIFGSQQLLDSCKSILSLRNTVGKEMSSSRNYYNEMIEIKSNLIKLKKSEGFKDLKGKVKTMEECQDKLEEMEKKYFMKLIEMC